MYTSILKPDAFLTVQEVAEWLGIDEQVLPPNPEVKASKVIQQLKYVSLLIGTLGNAIGVQYSGGATAGSEVISVTANAITVQIEDGVSTAQNILDAVMASVDSNVLVTVALDTSVIGDEVQTLQAMTLLAGGINEGAYPKNGQRNRRILETVINMACDKIEREIQTRVVARTFTDIIDGNNSNVVIPSKWPILKVESIYVDYNRGFSETTKINEVNYFNRGYADNRQDPSDIELRIIGNDVVLRDDGYDTIIGKIFSGSVLGSIKITYQAGWALNNADIPWDLRQATVLLCEYYYFQRSNRDLNTISKGVRGESYTKVKDGIPDTIKEMITPFCDISMPLFEKSQTNTFGL